MARYTTICFHSGQNGLHTLTLEDEARLLSDWRDALHARPADPIRGYDLDTSPPKRIFLDVTRIEWIIIGAGEL